MIHASPPKVRTPRQGGAVDKVLVEAGSLLAFTHARHALLSVAQPALGALLAAQGFPERRVVVLGTAAAVAGMLCVYPLNDLLDLPTDREEAARAARRSAAAVAHDDDPTAMKSTVAADAGGRHRPLGHPRVRHPLAHGEVPVWLAVTWVVGTGLTGFALATRLRTGCGLIFLGCVGLEALYCGLRRTTWLKTVPAGAVVGMGGLAGWYAVRDMDAGAGAYFALLTCWEIFGRNVANDLADRRLDAPLGIRTIATTHGPGWSVRTIAAGSLATLAVAAAQRGPIGLRLPLVATAAGTMALPARRLARRPGERQAQEYFDRASLFPPLALLATATYFLLRRRTAARR